MKKFFTLFSMLVMFAFSSQASYYLVGEEPFGNGWDPSNGLEMTDNGNGTYSVRGVVNRTIYFVLADDLAAPGDWTTFNNNYRIGPTGGNQEVNVGSWITTQKAGGDNGAYKFTGTGSEYVITYNPAIKKFKIEGYVAPINIDTYTVAGTPASIFGTEWDPTNTANDMVKQSNGITYALTKYGCQLAGDELQFKVVGTDSKTAPEDRDWGHEWPDQNYVAAVEESGIYDVTFNFNPSTKEVWVDMVKSGSFDPRTGDLFVLGEVNGNTWAPDQGVMMDTEDHNVFTTTITTAGENTDENDGIGYSFFSFTTKLGANADDWSSIGGYRIGALEDGYLLNEDMFGFELGLGSFGTSNSFKVPAGTYDLTVNLDDATLMITKHAGEEPLVGDVNGDNEISIADVNALVELILSGSTDSVGDVNKDREISIADVNALIDLILK